MTLDDLHLVCNPFPTAATGVLPPLDDNATGLYFPKPWQDKLENLFQQLQSSNGPKAIPVIGEYGMGKTTFLQGFIAPFFESRGYKVIYFENPGLQPYDLASALMRKLGRYEFAKALWEICKSKGSIVQPKMLFSESFKDWLNRNSQPNAQTRTQDNLRQAILSLKVTDDEEIAAKLARMIVETGTKPFFEYRDFVAGTKSSLVAERQEAQYFTVLVKCIQLVYQVNGVVFLLDEFEDIALAKNMTRSKGYQYLATLRQLFDLSNAENLWMVLAMTPDSLDLSRNMNPALFQRFVPEKEFELGPLSRDDAVGLAKAWLKRGRGTKFKNEGDELFPFAEDFFTAATGHPELLKPRNLIYLLRQAVEEALRGPVMLPIGSAFLTSLLRLYNGHDDSNA